MSSLVEHPVDNSAIVDRDLTQAGNPVDFSEFLTYLFLFSKTYRIEYLINRIAI